jgi:hypothetical protein
MGRALVSSDWLSRDSNLDSRETLNQSEESLSGNDVQLKSASVAGNGGQRVAGKTAEEYLSGSSKRMVAAQLKTT